MVMKKNDKRYEIKFLISGKEKNNFIIKNNLKCIFPDRIVESIWSHRKSNYEAQTGSPFC